MRHPLLIDAESLQQSLGCPGLVIIDVRGRAAYEFGGHIPGAVHNDVARV
ncbi:MAG: rhodanese-like domain-containing protein [Nitrospiraceae bacterium]